MSLGSAGTNGKGMSQLSASPASTAPAHAIGGRDNDIAVSVVSAMAGPATRSPAAGTTAMAASPLPASGAAGFRVGSTARHERLAAGGAGDRLALDRFGRAPHLRPVSGRS
jgi:hypothetical protein